MRKVGIIGGGNVGATCAYQLASRGAADVAVYDILEGVPAGKALDMSQVGPIFGFDGRVSGSHDVSIIEGSEVVVVTAGFPRKPGMDRMDLLKKNADIANASGEAIKKHAPDAVVITGRAWLTEHIVTEQTKFLYNPEVLFLSEPVTLEQGREYAVHIAYAYGCDTLDVEVDVQPA